MTSTPRWIFAKIHVKLHISLAKLGFIPCSLSGAQNKGGF
jgi:hypothetical protein